ncbi:hypothetical protein CF327_g2176 [Tilletia walkeri]|uniref:Uncharacterized protein n=1 Tax=Tilletia walkeri TaxID=117179 RepID=A0A8X7NG77_9BASI|nr:hypothetical protein CF327_g2176 [Tilletia walkeri]KAE8271959.1 hypothetical protein A4X09_0g379 [Tilletia walkeri]
MVSKGLLGLALLALAVATTTASPLMSTLNSGSDAIHDRATNLAPNAVCFNNADCASGICKPSGDIQCLGPDGGYVDDFNGYCGRTNDNHGGGIGYCAQFALGHSCAVNGDCAEGFCTSGTCSQSQIGDKCLTQLQCTGDQVCGTDGKCYVPAVNSLAPSANCTASDQCLSQRCCDLFSNGEGPCRSYLDCVSGLCKADGSTCQIGQDGDRCIESSQCSGICTLAGLCFTPAQGQHFGAGQPVKNANQCLSGSSYPDTNLTRPSALDPSTSITVLDNACSQSDLGDGCAQDSDCSVGLCGKNGQCAKASKDAACSCATDCASGACDLPSLGSTGSGNGTVGTCGLTAAGYSCAANSDCFSQLCRGNAGQQKCQPVTTQGTCRISSDCADGSSCDVDLKCRLSAGQVCTSGDVCLGGLCLGGSCQGVPSNSPSTTSNNVPARAGSASIRSSQPVLLGACFLPALFFLALA